MSEIIAGTIDTCKKRRKFFDRLSYPIARVNANGGKEEDNNLEMNSRKTSPNHEKLPSNPVATKLLKNIVSLLLCGLATSRQSYFQQGISPRELACSKCDQIFESESDYMVHYNELHAATGLE